jgi:hypothetical protein
MFNKELDMVFHENLDIFYIMWFKNFSIPFTFSNHIDLMDGGNYIFKKLVICKTPSTLMTHHPFHPLPNCNQNLKISMCLKVVPVMELLTLMKHGCSVTSL